MVLALAIGALSAGAASAEPLCRDLKGLFTPCPRELNSVAARRLEARTVRQWVTRGKKPASLPSDAQTSVVTAQTPAASTHLPFVAGITSADPGALHRTKLCHDLKGLFTPCPKP